MDTLLAISALQHYAYCPRQFALIHLEQAWSDNHLRAQGNVLRERIDSHETETRGSKRSERSVEVRSERLDLYGKLDLLEVFTLAGGSNSYVLVEYKRGKRKVIRPKAAPQTKLERKGHNASCCRSPCGGVD